MFTCRTLVWLLLTLLPATSALAQQPCSELAARFTSVQGQVQVRGNDQSAWRSANRTDSLCRGDTIRVGEHSRAAIVLVNEAVMRLDQNTTMQLVDVTAKATERSVVEVIRGAIQSFIRKPKLLSVNTPYLNGSIEGTEFLVRAEDDRASITVLEGRVFASNELGNVTVAAGESAEALAGAAPQRRIVVRPRDQVQWAIHYPPILSARRTTTPLSKLDEAENCLADRDSTCAFAAFEQCPRSERGTRFHLLRAATLLSVGRVEQARADVDAAIALDPAAEDAYSLRTIIAVALDQKDVALSDSSRAVGLNPNSGTARIAQSYALQANHQLDAARRTLLEASKRAPYDALAWARLAEVQLMLGERRTAINSARKAVQLQPESSQALSVLGFAALAEIDPDRARDAFIKAIELDSADPLPHLGLGLARIRLGDLAGGRAEMESAVALDSGNALLRAYLGKAYFEEKRAPLDAEQLALAKELDPLDPTAYFYDAIRLQTENQPGEATSQVAESIARNDKRAIYRSRLLLDQDRAARGISAARAYANLGFSKLGVDQATRSVTIDPANASAHRFLSDTYRNLARHETARVSELQQAQMLQDINVNPIQPSISETNLNIVTQAGPAVAGFNEFTPLFERNGVQANVSVVGGSMHTFGGEAVGSLLHDRVSLSAGAFGYETDGFRPNNDLDNEVYNVFAQFAVTTQFNVQAEYQSRDSKYGDVRMNFDPDSYSAQQRNQLKTDSARLGLRFSPSARSTLLFLYNYKKADYSLDDQSIAFVYPTPPFPPDSNVTLFEGLATQASSSQYEGAFVHQAESFNVLVGAAYTKVEREDDVEASLLDPLFGPPFPVAILDTLDESDSKDTRAYVYANLVMPVPVTWTLGLSYQRYDDTAFDLTRYNPKLGVQWQVDDTLQLRAAYFSMLKPALASNRTLEPTQIAGFNQFFDDADGTRSTRYGIGADWKPRRNLAMGAELTRRQLKYAAFLATTPPSVDFEDRDEWTHRAYGYWIPNSRLSLSLEAVYDKFESMEDSLLGDVAPERVRTISVPLRAMYHHPNGLFGGVGLTYVDQSVERSTVSTLPEGESDFLVVDLSIGYRLPKRHGVLSLGVHNLFDKRMKYQDDSYRTFRDEPAVSPYTPQRVIMGKLSLSF